MSMTIQQAIARIEDHVRVHRIGEPPHIHIGEALQMAIEALREKAERENPKPLTIKELRGMMGEPVYVVGCGGGHWEIFEDYNDASFWRSDGAFYMAKSYGKTWHACRHKPKEG